MGAEKLPRLSFVPLLAAGISLALLVAPFWPALFPVVVGVAGIAACALALVRRRSRPLLQAIAGIAVWLMLGLAGAWFLRDRALAGLSWVLGVLYLLPLPLIPWLDWSTFEERRE